MGVDSTLCHYPLTQAGFSSWDALGIDIWLQTVEKSTHCLHSHSVSHSIDYKSFWEVYFLFVLGGKGKGLVNSSLASTIVRNEGSNACWHLVFTAKGVLTAVRYIFLQLVLPPRQNICLFFTYWIKGTVFLRAEPKFPVAWNEIFLSSGE